MPEGSRKRPAAPPAAPGRHSILPGGKPYPWLNSGWGAFLNGGKSSRRPRPDRECCPTKCGAFDGPSHGHAAVFRVGTPLPVPLAGAPLPPLIGGDIPSALLEGDPFPALLEGAPLPPPTANIGLSTATGASSTSARALSSSGGSAAGHRSICSGVMARGGVGGMEAPAGDGGTFGFTGVSSGGGQATSSISRRHGPEVLRIVSPRGSWGTNGEARTSEHGVQKSGVERAIMRSTTPETTHRAAVTAELTSVSVGEPLAHLSVARRGTSNRPLLGSNSVRAKGSSSSRVTVATVLGVDASDPKASSTHAPIRPTTSPGDMRGCADSISKGANRLGGRSPGNKVHTDPGREIRAGN